MAELGSKPGILGLLSVSKLTILSLTKLLIAIIFGFCKSTTGETSTLSVVSVSSKANDFSLLSKLYSFTFEAIILGLSR